jgi:hypothetical protein
MNIVERTRYAETNDCSLVSDLRNLRWHIMSKLEIRCYDNLKMRINNDKTHAYKNCFFA